MSFNIWDISNEENKLVLKAEEKYSDVFRHTNELVFFLWDFFVEVKPEVYIFVAYFSQIQKSAILALLSISFKLFYWLTAVINEKTLVGYKFDPQLIPNDLKELGGKIYELYCKIHSIEIWSEATKNSLIKPEAVCKALPATVFL